MWRKELVSTINKDMMVDFKFYRPGKSVKQVLLYFEEADQFLIHGANGCTGEFRLTINKNGKSEDVNETASHWLELENRRWI